MMVGKITKIFVANILLIDVFVCEYLGSYYGIAKTLFKIMCSCLYDLKSPKQYPLKAHY